MKIAIIDLGISNIASVKNTLEAIGFDSEVVSDPNKLENKDKLILPGVGTFPRAMEAVRSKNWDLLIKKKNV